MQYFGWTYTFNYGEGHTPYLILSFYDFRFVFLLTKPVTIFNGLNFISLPTFRTFCDVKVKMIKMDYTTATYNAIHNLAPAPYIICIIVQQYYV